MAEITPGDLDLEVDIEPTKEMSNHAQQHNAANKAIVDLVNELGGEVVDGNINIEGGLGGGVPAPKPEDAMKVLATDGSNYDWAQLTTQYLPLAEPQPGIDAFGIEDEPANTQKEANEAFLKWIGINTESIEGLADALGLVIKIENDNIVIEIDPSGDGILDVSNKFDKGDGVLEYETAVILGQAVKKNEGSISTNTDNITINSNNFASLLAELNLEIDGEGSINIIGGGEAPSLSELEQGIADNATAIADKFDIGAGTTNLNDANLMEAAIDENAVAITKNTNSITDISSNIGGTVNIDGTVTFPENVETDLSKLATKQEREDGDTANANAIGKNADEIESISIRLDALENTSLSSEWKIRVDGGGPDAGEVSLNNAAWESVTVLKISTEDENGTSYNFENVKTGDTIQIGVGASGRAAGSSAAYTITSVTGGEFGVEHLASTGAPTPGFTAVVAVYPQFDPSSYATAAELNAVEADKLSKGAGLVAANAKVLEDAINTNAGDISTNATNIETNKTNIEANKTNIENVVNIIGGEVTDGNITLPDPIDIDSKFDAGDTTAADAKELEDKIATNATNISTNATNIEAVVEVLGGDIENIENIQIDALPPQTGEDGKFLTTDGTKASWAEIDIPDALPGGGSEGDFLSQNASGDAVWVDADVFPKGTSSYDDARAMEDALNKKIDELGDELSGVVTPIASADFKTVTTRTEDNGEAQLGSLSAGTNRQITFDLEDVNGNKLNFSGVSSGDKLNITQGDVVAEYNILNLGTFVEQRVGDIVTGPGGETIQTYYTVMTAFIMDLSDGTGTGTFTEGAVAEFSVTGLAEGRAVSAEYVDTQDAKKFDVADIEGEKPVALNNARTMERAIAQTINNLGWVIKIESNGDVTVELPENGGKPNSTLEDKLDKGATNYKDAKDIEDAINSIQGFETLKFVDSVETLDDLPPAIEHPDMLYYVESEEQFYASNGETWVKLSNFGITADEIADISNQIAGKFNLRDIAGNEPEFYDNAALVEKDLLKKDSQLTMLVTAFGYKWDYNEEGDLVLLPIDPEGGGGVEDNILATKFDKGTSEDNELSYADAYHMGVAIDDAALKVSTLEGKVESLETNTPEGLATEEYVDNSLIPYAKQEDLTLLAAEVELKATLMHVTQAEYDNLKDSDSIDKNTLYVVSA